MGGQGSGRTDKNKLATGRYKLFNQSVTIADKPASKRAKGSPACVLQDAPRTEPGSSHSAVPVEAGASDSPATARPTTHNEVIDFML